MKKGEKVKKIEVKSRSSSLNKDILYIMLAVLAVLVVAFIIISLLPKNILSSPSDNVVLNLTLNEGTGTNAHDFSGYVNNGVLSGGGSWPNAINGTGINFNGVNSYVTVQNNDSLNPSGNLTLLAWVYLKGRVGSGNHYLFDKFASVSGDNTGYSLYFNGGSGDDLNFNAFTDGNSPNAQVTLGNYNSYEDSWHLIAGVYNGTNAILYIDGNQVAKISKTGSIMPNSNTLVIGADNGVTASEFLNATVDNLRIYSKALSASEISSIYAQESSRIVLDLELNEGSGNTAYDSSGDFYQGVITGGTWTQGIFGNSALNFSGTGNIEVAAEYSSLNSFSVGVWFLYKNYSSSYSNIIEKQTSVPYINYVIYVRNSDHTFGAASTFSGVVKNIATGIHVNDSKWHYAVYTLDDASKSIKLYLDGVIVASNSSSGSVDTPLSDLIVGGDSSNGFKGSVDGIKIWNYAISAAQVASEYSQLDKIPPYFTYISNVSVHTNEGVGIDFNAADETGFSCFSVNDTANFAINCSGWLKNITGLVAGIYNLNITINDTSNNLNSSVIRVNVSNPQAGDTVYPIFSNYYDNSGTLQGSGTALFNVTVAGTNGTVWLSINGSTFYATNLSDVYTVSVTVANGTYTYNWNAYGNGASHNTNVSVNKDYTVISICPECPSGCGSCSLDFAISSVISNNSNLNSRLVNFRVLSTQSLSECKISINGAANITMQLFNSTYANYTNNFSSDGNENAMFSCKNLSNFAKSLLINFSIDSIAPVVKLISPLNESDFTAKSNILFKFNVSDANGIDKCWLITDDSSVRNETDSPSISTNISLTWTATKYARDYDWKVECQDLTGNIGDSEERTLTLACPSGQVECANNECMTSCTSSSGTNTGTGGSSASGGGTAAACTATCTSLNYNCGRQVVCQGLRDCGNCTSGNSCVSGRCALTTSTCTDTCNSLGYQCGEWKVCGSQQNCGICAEGQTCSSNGSCENKSSTSNTSFWLIVIVLLVPILILIAVIVLIIIRESRKKKALISLKKAGTQANANPIQGNPGLPGLPPRPFR